ncbi:hypothetical protein CIHG_09288 [Coccidioides immitis H538.4]|uniref:Uncharacterized protein n=2 Tax=Coccidioides immitis TaxID=5501 RepID=A0A0J8S4X5_COCIT|nr:hypothetical protein CIRG_05531 [Coccidioides immitis RMSCC 2394]KMU91419.1 hypothetical protein CIHG_09288 [Coccidioides immitis H538.4]
MEPNNQNQNKKRYLSSKGEQAGLSVLIQKGKQTRSGSVEVVYSPKIPGGHERGKQCGVQRLEPWTLYEEQEKYDEFTMIYVFFVFQDAMLSDFRDGVSEERYQIRQR